MHLTEQQLVDAIETYRNLTDLRGQRKTLVSDVKFIETCAHSWVAKWRMGIVNEGRNAEMIITLTRDELLEIKRKHLKDVEMRIRQLGYSP